GRRVSLRELHDEQFRGGSSFSVKRLRATLDDGEQLEVFFNDLNPLHQLAEARRIRSTGLDRSRREPGMDREVLDSERLGTPQLDGLRWEPQRGLLWLFIEDVGPKRLSRLGDFELWVAAARWLARLHVALAGVEGEQLMRHDPADSRRSAEQLALELPNISAAQRAVIGRALELHDQTLDSLDEQPWGLIHGEYFGENVVIRPGPVERRFAVIDWETAAHGPL